MAKGTGTSKMKGVAKKMGAALSGDAGILKTLEGEHAEVSSLMKKVIDAGEHGIETRLELFPEIRKKLLVHAKGEELEFYPVCREHPDTRELATESIDDHKEVERLIVQLDNLPIDAPAWLETLETLRDEVEEHVELEENELFPQAKQALGKDRLRELDGAYKRRKETLEQRVADIEPQRAPEARPLH